jgi:two-component system, response regulator YesN
MNTVLVVDDELIIRKGIVKIVQQYPGRRLIVHSAENGVDALEFLSTHTVQVVMTDIRMPKMDGLALCEQISRLYPHTKIIVISGFDDFSYAKQAMRFGVREYMLKPAFPPDIYTVLDQVFKEWDGEAQTFSLSKYEEWIDAMEESIWALNMERIPQLLEQWEEACKGLGLRSDQLDRLLIECLNNIKKRMQKRSFQPNVELLPQLEALSISDRLAKFKEQIMAITDQLSRIRGAKFRDPFEEAKKYIDDHLSEEISLEELSQRVGISPTYFSHLFKKETNETFVQYRTRKRMEKAKELMDIPHYRIIDICQAVGYMDYPHFTKTFKKYTGYSPSEYRKRMGILP